MPDLKACALWEDRDETFLRSRLGAVHSRITEDRLRRVRQTRRPHHSRQCLDGCQDLVSPGNFYLVRQGMRMKIVPTERLEWPPPYKAATEKYSAQVGLNDQGELQNYVAGQPFPLLDPNDPHVATKVMWNFSFRPNTPTMRISATSRSRVGGRAARCRDLSSISPSATLLSTTTWAAPR